MSSRLQRALARMSNSGAQLLPVRTGEGYAVFPNGDRRRRPLAKISSAEVRALASDGVVEEAGGAFALTDAGRSRVRRGASDSGEAFIAQQRPISDRVLIDHVGGLRRVSGHDAGARQRRLLALKDAEGRPLLTDAELGAARQMQSDWDAAQAGLVRGSDWSAAPLGGVRGSSNAQERAIAARCDAHRRLTDMLHSLAPPLRRVVEAMCLREEGVEAFERTERWPARSGKLALKLALAQLAESMRTGGLRGGARDGLNAAHHREEAV